MNDTESAEKRLRMITADVGDATKRRILQGIIDGQPESATARAAARLLKEIPPADHASPRNKMGSVPEEK